jgi:hypothetical protein
MLITAATMMFIEIAAGWWYNSMALLADGWHMSSHAVAIGLSALAYSGGKALRRTTGSLCLRNLEDREYSPVSPAPSSCIGVALMMVSRFGRASCFSPQPIQFQRGDRRRGRSDWR